MGSKGSNDYAKWEFGDGGWITISMPMRHWHELATAAERARIADLAGPTPNDRIDPVVTQQAADNVSRAVAEWGAQYDEEPS